MDIKAEQFQALYHHKYIKNNFERLVLTSNSIQLHIKRALLQCYHWTNATKPTMATGTTCCF